MADLLREYGFIVIEAVSAEEAIALLKSGANVELVFSDIRLPGPMDGLEFARNIRSEYPQIRLLLTSGSAVLKESDRDCHDGFFSKPYVAEHVITRIAKLLDYAIDAGASPGAQSSVAGE